MAKRGPPCKFTPEIGKQIIERIRQGATKEDAAGSVGITRDTLWRWESRFPTFQTDMARAEDEVAVRCAALVQKAALGWEQSQTTRTSTTEFRKRKTKQPDGTVVEDWVPFEKVTESATSGREWDWKAALEWLKRRRPEQWGDALKVEMMRRWAAEAKATPEEDLLRQMGYDPSEQSESS